MWRIVAVVLTCAVLSGSADGQCTTDPGTALYEIAYHCVRGALDGDRSPSSELDLMNVTHWQQHCRDFGGVYACLDVAFKGCGANYTDTMYQAFLGQLGRRGNQVGNRGVQDVCDGDQVNQNFTNAFEAADHLRCVTAPARVIIANCLSGWNEEKKEYRLPYTPLDLQLLRRWTLATFQCVLAPVRAIPACPPAVEELLIKIVFTNVDDQLRDVIKRSDIAQAAGAGAGLSTRRSTVGVFGDPHLELYSGHGMPQKLMTCSAPGWQEYIRNAYLVIRGRNVPVHTTSRATTVRQIVMEFLNPSTGEIIATYDAADGDIPLTFTSGLKEVEGGKLSVSKVDSKKVRFVHRSQGHVIFLRHWGPHYFFTLRMADDLLATSGGQLIYGCKRSEQISTSSQPQRRRRAATSSICKTACQHVTPNRWEVDYNAACIFDCLEMGNTHASDMTEGYLVALSQVEYVDKELPLTDGTDNNPSAADTHKPAATLAILLVTSVVIAFH